MSKHLLPPAHSFARLPNSVETPRNKITLGHQRTAVCVSIISPRSCDGHLFCKVMNHDAPIGGDAQNGNRRVDT